MISDAFMKAQSKGGLPSQGGTPHNHLGISTSREQESPNGVQFEPFKKPKAIAASATDVARHAFIDNKGYLNKSVSDNISQNFPENNMPAFLGSASSSNVSFFDNLSASHLRPFGEPSPVHHLSSQAARSRRVGTIEEQQRDNERSE